MKAQVIPCGKPVNDSERRAFSHFKRSLESVQGDDLWYLLTNLSFSSRNDRQSDEIDLVAVGPSGVRVVEVKHWGPSWIMAHPQEVAQQAEKVTLKAKRVGAALRRKYPETGHVNGVLVTTVRPHAGIEHLRGSRVRGVPFHALEDWKLAIGFDSSSRLSQDQVEGLAKELAPLVPSDLEGRVGKLCGCTDLELQASSDAPFHRAYQGLLRGTDTRVVLHLYDLSLAGGGSRLQAQREFEALNHLYKQPWTPRVRDSFQDVREYPGELCYFSILDPGAPSLAKRARDSNWDIHSRLAFALNAVRSLKQLHSVSDGPQQFLHRNLTPDTILVAEDDSPILTGFELARIPAEITLASVPPNLVGGPTLSLPRSLKAGCALRLPVRTCIRCAGA